MVKKAASTAKNASAASPGVSAHSKGIAKASTVDNKALILEGLQKLKRNYELEKVKGKVFAYKKAIATI